MVNEGGSAEDMGHRRQRQTASLSECKSVIINETGARGFLPPQGWHIVLHAADEVEAHGEFGIYRDDELSEVSM